MYNEHGSGRCAGWANSDYIMTKDALSSRDRGSGGKSIEQCQKECSGLNTCRYAVSNNDWCYLWSKTKCTTTKWNPYNKVYKTYKKTGRSPGILNVIGGFT